jgi:hypothetical protein
MANPTPTELEAIWTALDKLSRRHSGFPGAAWVLPEPDLIEIDQLAAMFRPTDLVAKHRFLFDEQMPDLGTTRADLAAYESALAERRKDAILEIVKTDGAAGVDRLLDTAKDAFSIGWSVAAAGAEISAEDVLRDLDNSNQHRAAYALGYARGRFSQDGIAWVDGILGALSGRPVAQARVLRVSPMFPDVWTRATDLGQEVESLYWREFLAVGLGQDFQLLSQASEKLLEHGRPATVVDLLAVYADRPETRATPELIARALESLLTSPTDEQQRVSPYEIQKLLEVLRNANFDENRLSLLEWRLLPGLGYGTSAPTLENRLARDPQFFVEVLSISFRRSDGSIEQKPAPEVAQNAFQLLHEWRVVPGSTERGGDVDNSKLQEWLEGAFTLLRAADRVAIGSVYIGHAFAHAKTDEDGTWPTKPVRDAIERLASDDVDRGFGTQIFNNRGVITRSLTEGGAQERTLAEQLEKLESLIRDRWPRTAAVVRSVAQSYRAQGQAEDEEAERFKKGLDPF